MMNKQLPKNVNGDDLVMIRITLNEAALLKRVRSIKFGEIIVYRAEDEIVRIEVKGSEKLIPEEGWAFVIDSLEQLENNGTNAKKTI